MFSLLATLILMGVGTLLILAASPSVSAHYTGQSFHFVKRHLMMLVPGFSLLIGCAWLSPKGARRVSLILYFVSLVLLILTFWMGVEIKGARRWLSLGGGLTLQPSEFAKPALVVLCAWMFSEAKRLPTFPGNSLSFALYALVAFLLTLQPDFGMTFLITSVWLIQFFLSGLSLIWVGLAVGLASGACVLSYLLLPHVQQRIHIFFSQGGDRFGDQFQILQSIDSFASGGLWGRGPGEGIIKKSLPDAHADFIFAVAGEEFGFVLCAGMIALFSIVIFRSLWRAFHQSDLFIFLAVSGLSLQLALQIVINMASTLHLIPAKGMTLPFISYGGSSLWSASITVGFLLALTRKRIDV